jgi:uncharacterized membrane protein YphA (DoxX/SURF4 family)
MEIAATIAAVILGAAFVVAGASKLAARDTWPAQAEALGAPAWTVPLVPWFELGVGALLAVQIARSIMALVAIALLTVFTVMIAVKLRQGQRPPCACFGAWSAKPIGAGHIARNLALIAVGVVAAL